MRFRIAFLPWLKGKQWRLSWRDGGIRSELRFASEEEAEAAAARLAVLCGLPARFGPFRRARRHDMNPAD